MKESFVATSIGYYSVIVMWKAFVLSKLYGWFVRPEFSLPHISYWTVYGIVLILYLLDYKTRFAKTLADERPIFELSVRIVCAYTLILVLGYAAFLLK
jgi:hypothetical protein